jgi:RNA polymerase sigma-70 factor (ECF subfamily)
MDVTDPNEELVARLREGDQSAFVELFVRNRQRLKRILEFRMDRRLKGREDSSDILQEVFLDAQQRLRHFRAKPHLSFFVWLRQLTHQRMIDEHRKHLQAVMRDARQEVSMQQLSAPAASAAISRRIVSMLATPSEEFDYGELVSQVALALERLDPIDREVLAMRHFEELKNHEVAQILGIKQAAASNRYIRALTRLREVIEECPQLNSNLNLDQ